MGADWGKLFEGLVWTLAISVPLALWKVIDIVIWLSRHLHLEWK